MTVNIRGLGKITASEDVLSALSLAFGYERDYLDAHRKGALAAQADFRSHVIHEALDNVGYYDNIE